MAKIQPTSGKVRRRYRETLPGPRQQSAFDELGRLIDSPRDDLAWYHRVGQLVGRLRPEVPRGTRWARRLSEALGPSPDLLAKARRFAELYPSREDVAELEAMGVNWTRLYFAFAISDPEKRHALPRRAVRERWPDQQMRFTVQQRSTITGLTQRRAKWTRQDLLGKAPSGERSGRAARRRSFPGAGQAVLDPRKYRHRRR